MKWFRSKGVEKGDPACIWEQERQNKAKKVAEFKSVRAIPPAAVL